jgi:hypothetical protein
MKKKNTWGSYSTFPTRFRVFVNVHVCIFIYVKYMVLAAKNLVPLYRRIISTQKFKLLGRFQDIIYIIL